MSILLNQGNGTWAAPVDLPAPSADDPAMAMASGDLDGKLDVVVVTIGGVYVLTNTTL